jgi:hypothetical protein
MNIDALKKFLIETKKAGYGAGDSKKWIKEKDGSTTIIFESGDFRMRDNFFGGEPYGGNDVIFYKGQAVWMMVYYGLIIPSISNLEEVYEFLKKALRQQPEDLPLRGPKLFKDGEFTYKNKVKGGLEDYVGEETIFKNKVQIYKANYSGGLVDLRKE